MPDVNTNSEQGLDRWLATPRGRLLIQRERRQLQRILPHIVGYRLLQIGDWELGDDVWSAGGTLCHWRVGQRAGANIRFDGESLPISSKCLDAVVLTHGLEASASPHRLLREVDRALCDRGQLIIMGFNPYSTWAVIQWLRRRGFPVPGLRGLYSLGRVCDWLDLLDFEVCQCARYGIGFPYLPEQGVHTGKAGLWRLPAMLAQSYVLVARKRVIPVTPARERRPRRTVVPAGMPEPTARVSHDGNRIAA